MLSMRGNDQVLMYFGFLRGKISKIFFLLFCATLVFPFGDTDGDYMNWIGGVFLAFCAILQLIKYCTSERDDHNDSAVMEEATENLV